MGIGIPAASRLQPFSSSPIVTKPRIVTSALPCALSRCAVPKVVGKRTSLFLFSAIQRGNIIEGVGMSITVTDASAVVMLLRKTCFPFVNNSQT